MQVPAEQDQQEQDYEGPREKGGQITGTEMEAGQD
jgi:hypothetical protein